MLKWLQGLFSKEIMIPIVGGEVNSKIWYQMSCVISGVGPSSKRIDSGEEHETWFDGKFFALWRIEASVASSLILYINFVFPIQIMC